ncbi:MAG: ABC transporter ATP-binding protein [Proteobacteria bacterium]|nr:ABC transporter ATP-binding protein [Pseudomonadota bacterium]
MIEVSNLKKSYGGTEALKGITFSVQKGEVVGFLGPNGAGKSTTMKIITGFMAPTSGIAKVCGFDVFDSPLEVKKRIGYLPEQPPVYLDMKVHDYLKYVAQLKGVESGQLSKAIQTAVEKTQLGDVRHRLIGNLSKGFRQRVGIAQALVSSPEVLILDEPTVGLDPKQVAEIRELIQELKGEHTIILSTHILPEVQATCERIVIIHQGKIVAQDSLSNLSRVQAGLQKIHLKVRKWTSESQTRIAALPGVLKLEKTGDSMTIEGEPREDLVDVIASSVISQGLGLQEISSSSSNLEDIFLNLTYGSGGAQ